MSDSFAGHEHCMFFYERGEKSPYETIAFGKFSVEWLTDGVDGINPK